MKLKPNRKKILESIIFLIEEGARIGEAPTQYHIAKSIFYADTAHLNAYGRPVTFDNYSALKFGPVPEEAYDMLKPVYDWQSRMGMASAPWTRVAVSDRVNRFIDPTRRHDERALSRTDTEALRAGLLRVRELGFGGVVDDTHEHPAYVKAWTARGQANAKAMDYSLLFEEPDPEGAEHIAYASAHT